MPASDAVRYQFDAAGALIAGVSADQLDGPTPCAEWAVRDLISHLVAGSHAFGTMLAGGDASLPESPPQLSGDDLDAIWTAARAPFVDGLDSEGALDRMIDLPFGTVPAEVLVAMLKFDVLVHCHDLARATGQVFDPPADVVAEARAIAEGSADGLREAGAMAPAVDAPEGASPIDALSAYCGRAI